MEITQLSDEISISPQLQIADLKAVKDLGFDTIVINRPDGEGKNQPSHHALNEALSFLGMTSHYIPVVPGRFSKDSVDAFAAALQGTSGKTLAFCKTGMRSRRLWELAFRDETPCSKMTFIARIKKWAKPSIAP